MSCCNFPGQIIYFCYDSKMCRGKRYLFYFCIQLFFIRSCTDKQSMTQSKQLHIFHPESTTDSHHRLFYTKDLASVFQKNSSCFHCKINYTFCVDFRHQFLFQIYLIFICESTFFTEFHDVPASVFFHISPVIL